MVSSAKREARGIWFKSLFTDPLNPAAEQFKDFIERNRQQNNATAVVEGVAEGGGAESVKAKLAEPFAESFRGAFELNIAEAGAWRADQGISAHTLMRLADEHPTILSSLNSQDFAGALKAINEDHNFNATHAEAALKILEKHPDLAVEITAEDLAATHIKCLQQGQTHVLDYNVGTAEQRSGLQSATVKLWDELSVNQASPYKVTRLITQISQNDELQGTLSAESISKYFDKQYADLESDLDSAVGYENAADFLVALQDNPDLYSSIDPKTLLSMQNNILNNETLKYTDGREAASSFTQALASDPELKQVALQRYANKIQELVLDGKQSNDYIARNMIEEVKNNPSIISQIPKNVSEWALDDEASIGVSDLQSAWQNKGQEAIEQSPEAQEHKKSLVLDNQTI